MDQFETDPDFINDHGVKWWLHKQLTEHAHRGDGNGITLPNYRVFLVLTPQGKKNCLILDGNDIIYENTDLCAVYDTINMHKIVKFYD